MQGLQKLLQDLDKPFLEIGNWHPSLLKLILLVALPILVFLGGRLLRKTMSVWLRRRKHMDPGVQNAVTSITYYVFLLVGLAATFQAVGFDLTGLAVFSGALGIGVGIGLQDVAKNFISGIIIPNSQLLNTQLTNWTHDEVKRMVMIPFGVHYNSDIDQVMALLLQASKEHPDVLKDPEPSVLLTGFGESSVNFSLNVWTEQQVFTPGRLRSEINQTVWRLFYEAGVVLPYPQREVTLTNAELPAKMRGSS